MKRLAALRRTPIGHALETVALLASIGYTVVAVFDKVDRYRRHVTPEALEPVVAIPVGDEPPPWPGHVAQQVHDAQEHAAATTVERSPSELLEDEPEDEAIEP